MNINNIVGLLFAAAVVLIFLISFVGRKVTCRECEGKFQTDFRDYLFAILHTKGVSICDTCMGKPIPYRVKE